MKKRLIALTACLFLLSSCNLNKYDGQNEMAERQARATLLVGVATNHITFGMDPFHVAFRLNALMTEAKILGVPMGDPALETIEKDLFGKVGAVSMDGSGLCTITFAGLPGKNDFIREGVVKIQTHGTPLATAENWEVIIAESAPLNVSIGGSTYMIYANSYLIAGINENQWEIKADQLRTKKGTDNKPTELTGDFILTQDLFPGDQSSAKIAASSYTLNVNISHATTRELSNVLNIFTPIDHALHYNPASCSRNQIVGNSKLEILLPELSIANSLYYATCEWGGLASNCAPTVTSNYYGPL